MRTHAPRIAAALALAALVACAARAPDVRAEPTPRSIVARAAAALGGADRIARVHTLVIEGSGTTRSFGQSVVPGAALPIVDIPHLRRVLDLSRGRWKEQRTQARRPPSPNTIPESYVSGVEGARAYTVDDNGTAALDPPAVALERRAQLVHHPLAALRAALAPAAMLANARRGAGRDLVDLTTADGVYTLEIDARSGLVTRIASGISDPVRGDVTLETAFADYQTTEGLLLPTQLEVRRDGEVVAALSVRNQLDVAEATAAPDGLPAAPPAPLAVTVERLADGVWLLGGGSHHSVLIQLGDRGLLVEAPLDDVRTAAVLAAARQVLGSTPLTHVVLSHHHDDHVGGVRTAVAAGLTIVAQAGARPLVEELVARRHTRAPDALAAHPRPLVLETVADRRTYGVGDRRVDLYPVAGNAHAATLLMVYVPHARLLVTADLFDRSSTGAFPFAANLVANVDRLGLDVERLVGLHGRPVPFRDVRAFHPGVASRSDAMSMTKR